MAFPVKILQFKENWYYEKQQTSSSADKEKTKIHSIKYWYPEQKQATPSAHHDYGLDPCRHTNFDINIKMPGFLPRENNQKFVCRLIYSV